jgi:predicted DCC family thiol-disulfide oxidoreductase YuxK
MIANNRPSQGLKFLNNYWNNYWFYPAPLFNLAISRIIIIGFQLCYLFAEKYLPNVLEQVSIPGRTYSPLPVFQLLNAPFPWDAPPSAFLTAVFFATAISGLLSLIGLMTNVSLWVFAIGNLYLQTYLYSFGSYHHPQALMLISLFVLALSPAGKALSVDDLSQRLKRNLRQRSFQAFNVLKDASAFARWPLLVIQWLFAITYFSAALNKLSVDGAGLFSAKWMNGYTLQYYLMADGLLWNSSLGLWLGQQHILAVMFSWVAILFEATLFLTLIFPSLVWIYIPMGAMFHIGIYMAQRAPFFQYLALYAVFIPWAATIKAISHRLKWSDKRRRAEIFYDGLCPICIRAMTSLCYFDWFQRLDYRDLEVHWPELSQRHPHISLEDCRAEMHLLKPDGTVKKGFFAVRDIIKYLPPLWPLLAIAYLPGAAFVGSKIYSLVASNRQRYQRCTFEQCSTDLTDK